MHAALPRRKLLTTDKEKRFRANTTKAIILQKEMNQINVSSTLNLPSVVCRMYFIKNRKEVALKDWEKQYVGRHVEDDEYLVC